MRMEAESAVVAEKQFAQEPKRGPNWLSLLESLALVGASAVLFALFSYLNPHSFPTWSNISIMLGSQSVLVMLALALIIPLTAGDFDLSIASAMSLAAMLLAILTVHAGIPLGVAIALSLLGGVVIGSVNAGFILFFRIPSLIVTLGMGTFLYGIVLWISGSNTITGLPQKLVTWVVVTRPLGIPIAFYYVLAVAALLWLFFGYTTAGRRFFSSGEAARWPAFLASTSVSPSACARRVVYSRLGGRRPLRGHDGLRGSSLWPEFLLPAFAAAFLGATTISPGRFNAWGTVIAVYFLVIGITGLTMLGIETYVQHLFYGGALVLAVSLSQLVRKREPQDFS